MVQLKSKGRGKAYRTNALGMIPETFYFNKTVNTFSYSAGLNYKISDHFAIYGKYSKGNKAPDQDLYFNDTTNLLIKTLNLKAQKVRQLEFGVKAKTTDLNLFVTLFYSVITLQKSKALDFSTWLANGFGPAYDSLVSYSGNGTDNIARSILNITPSYNIDKFYAQLTCSYMGKSKRQANVTNAFLLPSFSQFNFSAGCG